MSDGTAAAISAYHEESRMFNRHTRRLVVNLQSQSHYVAILGIKLHYTETASDVAPPSEAEVGADAFLNGNCRGECGGECMESVLSYRFIGSWPGPCVP